MGGLFIFPFSADLKSGQPSLSALAAAFPLLVPPQIVGYLLLVLHLKVALSREALKVMAELVAQYAS